MDKLIVGVFTIIIIIFFAGLAYFAIRPNPTVYSFGDPTAEDPTLNPYWIPPNYKYPLGYVCQSDDQCDQNLICDPTLKRCRYKDYSPCKDSSNCLTNSYCNKYCFSRTDLPVGYDYVSDPYNKPAPCPDNYDSADGTIVAPDGKVYNILLCKKSSNQICNGSDECASSGCADRNGNICNDNNCNNIKNIILPTLCVNKASNGSPCVINSSSGTNNCSSKFCYRATNGNYCQDANLEPNDSTIGMDCSKGMSCGDNSRCVNGKCTFTSSSLLQGCSSITGCPSTMMCYNQPFITYDSDGNPNGFSGTNYDICKEGDGNCFCTYYMDTVTNDAPPIPNISTTTCSNKASPSDIQYCGVYGTINPNKISSDQGQTCINGMTTDATSSSCVPLSGQPTSTDGPCYSTPTDPNEPFQGNYIFILSVSYDTEQNSDVSSFNYQQYYPINGVQGSKNLEYIGLPLDGFNESIKRIRGASYPIYDSKNNKTGSYEIVYIITNSGNLYECLLNFKVNGTIDRSITNYYRTSGTNQSDRLTTTITKINNLTSVVDVAILYLPTSATVNTSLYVLQNGSNGSNFYQTISSIARTNIGSYSINNTYNLTSPSTSNNILYDFLTGYYSWRTKGGDYTIVSNANNYFLASVSNGGKLSTFSFTISNNGVTKINNSSNFVGNASPSIMPVVTSAVDSSNNWIYYFEIGYSQPNYNGQVAIKPLTSSRDTEDFVPNYLEVGSPTSGSWISYNSYSSDFCEYFIDGNPASNSYQNFVATARYSTSSLGATNINLYYSSGNIITALPSYFTENTQLSLSPNELYIFTDYKCTPM